MRHVVRAVALACLVAVLAGCGSAGSGSPQATTADEATFLARAGAVCSAVTAQVDAWAVPVGTRQLLSYAERLQAVRERELAQLRALSSPPSLRARYAAYLADVAARVQATAALLHDAHSGLAGGSPPADDSAAIARVRAEARALGLSPCQDV